MPHSSLRVWLLHKRLHEDKVTSQSPFLPPQSDHCPRALRISSIAGTGESHQLVSQFGAPPGPTCAQPRVQGGTQGVGPSWHPRRGWGRKPGKPKAALTPELLLWVWRGPLCHRGQHPPGCPAHGRESRVSLHNPHLRCGGLAPGLWIPPISGSPELGKASGTVPGSPAGTEAADTGGKPPRTGMCVLKLRATPTCVWGGWRWVSRQQPPASHLP